MLNLPIEYPSFYWSQTKTAIDLKVKDWIDQRIPTDEDALLKRQWDIVVMGAPLSRSSISASGASEFPEHFRKAWKGFSTYNIDTDQDLRDLRVLDFGDIEMHVTDINKCHSNIKMSMEGICKEYPNSIPFTIGGDHSITAMLVSGLKAAVPSREIGILQFDTHLDLRDLKDQGPSNGTPIRNLIENGIVKGSNVYNIGLHGFFNGPSLINYAKEQKVNYITLRQARTNGIIETVSKAIQELESKVDYIYLTIDMDVLDIAYAPGVPASTTGGMRTDELFDAVITAGRSSKIRAVDIVCLDPNRDSSALPTVKAGVHTFLSFLSGFLNKG
ncbi:agmatinase family protein [Pseudoneobacillus rhizosphaerae]|uniref:Formimidoylglutamase n=1 Tax=Pseudoneobacillus rhizosphaerae TaxID=2880968 RepID=A0A9C7LC70_9BACI|nr:agmatinase family protein [Pseudoneobacillus rhizosphaerae]CAG9610217.1 Formimidoylglutamase [Pseudoneobacillus rhizosphaerae]